MGSINAGFLAEDVERRVGRKGTHLPEERDQVEGGIKKNARHKEGRKKDAAMSDLRKAEINSAKLSWQMASGSVGRLQLRAAGEHEVENIGLATWCLTVAPMTMRRNWMKARF